MSADSSTPVRAAEGRMLDVLRNRAFLRLWVVQALSQTGQNMINFALLILVRSVVDTNNLSQANTAIGLTVLSFSLPAIILSPIAGAVVERANKRTVLVVTNALRGVAVAGFLIVQPDWKPLLALSIIYSITFISGAVGQFFGPALGASIPLLVKQRNLVQANALFNLTFTVSQILGFAALGPFLIRFVGLNNVLLGIVVTFAICTLISMTIPSSPPTLVEREDRISPFGQMMHDVREGIVFIFQTPILVKSISYLALATASYLLVAVLGPEFTSGVLGLPPEDIFFVVGPAGLGIVAGGLLVGRITNWIGPERTIDIGLTAAGGFLIVLALIEPIGRLLWIDNGLGKNTIAVAAVLAAGLGLSNALVLAPSQTMLQANSPEYIRARVYASFFTVSNSVAFIPIIFAGALADLFGVVKILVALGVFLMLIGVFQLEGSIRRGHARSDDV